MTQYQPNVPSYAVPPLNQPYYGIGFGPAVARGFRKYAAFDGRASRGEYWWWVLAVNVVLMALGLLSLVIGLSTSTDGGQTPGTPAVPFLVVFVLVGLAVILPNLSALVRRLHDAGFSGWLALLALIPSIGGIVLLILAAMPTAPSGARYDLHPSYG